MKNPEPRFCLGIDFVRHVRDTRPTVDELLEWLGPSGAVRYYVLRKAGLLVEVGGRLYMSPEHLSADGKTFRYYNFLYWLDENRMDIYRLEPESGLAPEPTILDNAK